MNSHNHDGRMIPSLYMQNKGESSVKFALKMTSALSRFIIRITGGCGNMSVDDADGMYSLFSNALEGFDGGILFGGTRMISGEGKVIPSVTEIPTRIRIRAPDAVVLGVIPRTADLKLVPGLGMVVSDEPGAAYCSIVHPDQEACLLVQQSVDTGVEWEAEYRVCLEIIQSLRDFANWQSVLISYNGGSVTKKEILETAERGWPVILVDGSGRVTEELATDSDFLNKHPNVLVVERTSESLRGALVRLGALDISAEGHRSVIRFALAKGA
jgi:hypothetical protein